ncbi:MAG: hypothetical protein LAP13_20135 [Acidobacteriia bacterium]|nr:hypothetical protein [Terriglobia bacterium]
MPALYYKTIPLLSDWQTRAFRHALTSPSTGANNPCLLFARSDPQHGRVARVQPRPARRES